MSQYNHIGARNELCTSNARADRKKYSEDGRMVDAAELAAVKNVGFNTE